MIYLCGNLIHLDTKLFIPKYLPIFWNLFEQTRSYILAEIRLASLNIEASKTKKLVSLQKVKKIYEIPKNMKNSVAIFKF